jgi:hypothetical protein
MSTCLFKTKDRDESHRKLEEVLASGEHLKAECREADENGDYTVWSGPAIREPASTIEQAVASLDDTQLGKLADMIAARMKGG